MTLTKPSEGSIEVFGINALTDPDRVRQNIDSAEQEIPRPKNERKKKSYYSGKKKKHTITLASDLIHQHHLEEHVYF